VGYKDGEGSRRQDISGVAEVLGLFSPEQRRLRGGELHSRAELCTLVTAAGPRELH